MSNFGSKFRLSLAGLVTAAAGAVAVFLCHTNEQRSAVLGVGTALAWVIDNLGTDTAVAKTQDPPAA